MLCYVCKRELEGFSKRKHYVVGIPFDPPRGYSVHERVCPFCFKAWQGEYKWENLLHPEGISPVSAQPHKRRIAKLKAGKAGGKYQRRPKPKKEGA